MGDDTHKKIYPATDENVKKVIPPRILPQGSPNSGQHLRQPPPSQLESNSLSETKTRSGFSCCKCICWSISILILLLVIFAIVIGIIYMVFKPKIPNYSVDRLRITQLSLNLDFSLYARFDVKITATNPNKKIAIYYQKGSHLSVWYKNTNLCQGSLPVLYQGHQNKTVLDVALAGRNQYGRTLLAAIQEQQQTGRIPLDLKVDVPVRIELGKLKLMKVSILGKCLLVVDSLSTGNKISIKATSCKFRLKL